MIFQSFGKIPINHTSFFIVYNFVSNESEGLFLSYAIFVLPFICILNGLFVRGQISFERFVKDG